MKTQLVLGLALAAMFSFTASGFADSSTAAPASSGGVSVASNIFNNVRKNVTGSYLLELTGPNIRDLSGAKADKKLGNSSTNININHYFGIGYKIGSRWRIGMTQTFSQTIDEFKNADVDPLVAKDPYITLTNSKVLSSEKYGANLSAYIRYYAPLSRASSKAVAAAAADEYGAGKVRLLVAPTKTFLDGALTINLTSLINYHISSVSSQVRATKNDGDSARNDMQLVFNPGVYYQAAPKVEVYLEYATALDHTTKNGGHWGKYKDQDEFNPGVNYQITKRLQLNPVLGIAPRYAEFKKTSIYFNALYAFL